MIAKKMYERFLKYLDNLLVGEKQEYFGNSYWGNHLDSIFKRYKFRNDYLDLDDYLNEKAGVDFKDEPFIEGYRELNEEERTNFVVAIYNIYYFSDENQEIKQRLYSFFNRLGIIFSDDPEYKEALLAKKIGEGSYADVIEINDMLVYKQLKKEYWNNKDILSRFKAEYKTQNRLEENDLFLNVYDYDEIENKYIMDRGECSLNDYLEQNRDDLNKEDKVQIILQVLEGMKQAHQEGIIHRDLHIGNILKKENKFYVVDFGFAKDEKTIRSRMTSSSKRITHYFTAPEGLKSLKELDKQSDIFSLGKVIDYVMSKHLTFGEDHEFKYTVAKCCRAKKSSRYLEVEEIILAIKEKLKQKKDEGKHEIILEDIKANNLTPDVEEYLERVINLDKLAINIYENSWKEFHEIILALDDNDLKLKLINNLHESGATSTRPHRWSDYSILGRIAYELLITDEFDPNTEKQLCQIMNDCKNRFDIQDLTRDVIMNKSNPLREEYLS